MIDVVRKIDSEGRVGLPSDVRRFVGLMCGDEVSIEVEGDAVILRRSTPKCVLCGSEENIAGHFNTKPICSLCLEELVKSHMKGK